MSSIWPSALGSLDDSLALPYESVGKLKAANPVNLEDIIQQLTAAAESGTKLRASISVELPDASWQNREELQAVIAKIQELEEARRIEQLRSRLLAVATELERGEITHRRAARVTELNQLRELAIKELLSQGGVEGEPPTLPGPEADQWVEWACGLQEPEDADSLETLRQTFPQLDNFIANLEPDMWKPENPPEMSAQNAQDAEERKKAIEERRSRLSALATELESGSIVHHRVLRVNELNYLRDQAIKELRSQVKLPSGPKTLPGPEANQWIEWACSLQEPRDAEALQTLRKGFARLDDFIANLEPNMWKPAGAPPDALPEAAKPVAKPPVPEAVRVEEQAVASRPIPINLKGGKSSGGRGDKPRVQLSRDGSAAPQLEAEPVATPNYPTPSRSAEEIQRIQAKEREVLARIKGAVTEPVVRSFDHRIGRTNANPVKGATGTAPAAAKERVEAKATAAVVTASATAVAAEPVKAAVAAQTSAKTTPVRVIPEDSDVPSVTAKATRAIGSARSVMSDTWTEFVTDVKDGGAGALWQEKWRMPVIGTTVLVIALLALGSVYWVRRAHASNAVKAAETAAVPPSTPVSNLPAPAPDSVTTTAAAAAAPKPQPDKQPKTKDQLNTAAKPPEPAPSQPAPPVSAVDAALRLPQPVPKNNATAANREVAKEEPPPPNGANGVAGSVPGGLPNGAPSSVINVVKDLSAAEPKNATQKVSVSSGVAQGLLVHRVAPQYPQQAKQARLQGTVVLQAVIGKDGSVHSVRALKGNPVLAQAAMDAVKQWRYRPYALNGEPVEADTEISVTFSPQ
ncbi:MAG: energy transducer TonB [Candidatus Korobacteraceae bacterium]|jgi:protein TonB